MKAKKFSKTILIGSLSVLMILAVVFSVIICANTEAKVVKNNNTQTAEIADNAVLGDAWSGDEKNAYKIYTFNANGVSVPIEYKFWGRDWLWPGRDGVQVDFKMDNPNFWYGFNGKANFIHTSNGRENGVTKAYSAGERLQNSNGYEFQADRHYYGKVELTLTVYLYDSYGEAAKWECSIVFNFDNSVVESRNNC